MEFVFEELCLNNLELARNIDVSDIPTSFVISIDTLMELTEYGIKNKCIGHTFLVRLDGVYIAYLLIGEALKWETDPEEMEKEPFYRLMGFVVDKKYRNRGYGGTILEKAIEIVYQDFGKRSIALGCHKDNIKAAAFYKKHQFLPTGKFEGNDEYYLRLINDKYF